MDLRSALLAVGAVGLSGVVVAATTAGARGAFVDVAPIDLRRGEAPGQVVEVGPPSAAEPPGAEPTVPPAEGAPPVDARDEAPVDTGGGSEVAPRSDDETRRTSDAPAQGSTTGPVRRAPAPAPKPAPQPAATAEDDEDDRSGPRGGEPDDTEEAGDREEADKDDDREPDDEPDDDELDDERDSDDADADDRDDVLDD